MSNLEKKFQALAHLSYKVVSSTPDEITNLTVCMYR